MTTRLKSVVLATLLLLPAGWAFFGDNSKSAVVDGKSIAQWFYLSRYGSQEEKAEAHQAFDSAGNIGVDFLQKQLMKNSVAPPDQFSKLLGRVGITRKFRPLERNEQALLILESLGNSGSNAIPALLHLAKMGEEPRLNVYATLAAVGTNNDEVLQVLLNGLNTNDKKARANAAAALGKFGRRARPAVHTLCSLYRDSQSRSEREVFAQALEEIDPKSLEEIRTHIQ